MPNTCARSCSFISICCVRRTRKKRADRLRHKRWVKNGHDCRWAVRRRCLEKALLTVNLLFLRMLSSSSLSSNASVSFVDTGAVGGVAGLLARNRSIHRMVRGWRLLGLLLTSGWCSCPTEGCHLMNLFTPEQQTSESWTILRWWGCRCRIRLSHWSIKVDRDGQFFCLAFSVHFEMMNLCRNAQDGDRTRNWPRRTANLSDANASSFSSFGTHFHFLFSCHDSFTRGSVFQGKFTEYLAKLSNLRFLNDTTGIAKPEEKPLETIDHPRMHQFQNADTFGTITEEFRQSTSNEFSPNRKHRCKNKEQLLNRGCSPRTSEWINSGITYVRDIVNFPVNLYINSENDRRFEDWTSDLVWWESCFVSRSTYLVCTKGVSCLLIARR